MRKIFLPMFKTQAMVSINGEHPFRSWVKMYNKNGDKFLHSPFRTSWVSSIIYEEEITFAFTNAVQLINYMSTWRPEEKTCPQNNPITHTNYYCELQ